MKYTFTMDQRDEGKFLEVLSRLEPEEYSIIEDIHLVDEKDPRYSNKQTIIEMDPESCLTFRLGMKQIKIRRERTEEELAEEKAINDQNTVKITVYTGPAGTTTP